MTEIMKRSSSCPKRWSFLVVFIFLQGLAALAHSLCWPSPVSRSSSISLSFPLFGFFHQPRLFAVRFGAGPSGLVVDDTRIVVVAATDAHPRKAWPRKRPHLKAMHESPGRWSRFALIPAAVFCTTVFYRGDNRARLYSAKFR